MRKRTATEQYHVALAYQVILGQIKKTVAIKKKKEKKRCK